MYSVHSSEYAQLHTEYARIQRVVLYSVGVSTIHHRYVKNLAEYVASGRILVLGMPDYRPCSPSSMSLASSSSLESGSATGARCRAGGGRSVFPPFMAAVFDAPVCRRPRT